MYEGIKALNRTPPSRSARILRDFFHGGYWSPLWVSSQLADFLEPKLFVRLPGVLILGGPASIMNPKILSKGGKRMSEAIGCGKSQKSESVLGLLRYYEAILERKGLVARIGEIRSLKLGLILDLLKMVNIAEELKDKLISSMVSAWEMNGNDNALEESEEEIKSMLDSIADVRENALIAQHNCDPINLTRMDVSVMFALPLMTHDLNYNDIPQIRDLLNQVMEDFAERNEGGFALCP